ADVALANDDLPIAIEADRARCRQSATLVLVELAKEIDSGERVFPLGGATDVVPRLRLGGYLAHDDGAPRSRDGNPVARQRVPDAVAGGAVDDVPPVELVCEVAHPVLDVAVDECVGHDGWARSFEDPGQALERFQDRAMHLMRRGFCGNLHEQVPPRTLVRL